jgi:hypothetical protein
MLKIDSKVRSFLALGRLLYDIAADGDTGPLNGSMHFEIVVLLLKITLGFHCVHCNLTQDRLGVLITFVGLAGLHFVSDFIVAVVHPGPTGECLGVLNSDRSLPNSIRRVVAAILDKPGMVSVRSSSLFRSVSHMISFIV